MFDQRERESIVAAKNRLNHKKTQKKTDTFLFFPSFSTGTVFGYSAVLNSFIQKKN